MYPETKNHTVEEVSLMFDSRDDNGKQLNKIAQDENYDRDVTSPQSKGKEGHDLVGVSTHRENV